MNKRCLHFFAAGKVQRVWFRAHTQKQAQQLGITGWVRNLDDGRVEVFACGNDGQLAALQEWLWQGPERARVDAVTVTEAEFQEFQDFQLIK